MALTLIISEFRVLKLTKGESKIEIDSTDPEILKLLVKYGNEQFEFYKNNEGLKNILHSDQTLHFGT